MGQALSANITGTYTSAPTHCPTGGVTDAAVAGNGDMAIILGGTSSALRFYVGKADFFGVLRGQVQAVGSLLLSAPSLNGSPYSVKQNVGAATITGSFVNGSYGLAMSSWVASSENTAVIQLTNTGSQPLALTSQLTEGFEGTTGNPGTYGATNNSTWIAVSPDSVNIELGNQLYVQSSSPFTGAIADFKLFTNILSPSTLANIDATNAPAPLLQWQATNNGAAILQGSGGSIQAGDVHGGSFYQASGGNGELLVGDMPFPEHQFTISTWLIATASGENSCVVAAQIPYTDIYAPGFPYPYVRGFSLNLVNGALSATLNESGDLNLSSQYQTFFPDAVNKYSTTAGSALPTGTWILAAVTYDGNVMTLYTNGVQVGTPVTFPTGTNGMYGYNKMAVHLGDTNLIYNGCAPTGVMMQSVLGATATTNSQGTLAFTIPAGGQASLVLAAVTDRNKTNYFSAAQQQSQQATTNSLATLRQTHDAFWTNFWSKSFVQIPDQKIQDSWYASLYLLSCCSGTNSPPPGLWGNFVTSGQPSWSGDYTLDYNYEAPFYAGLANNHMELATNYEQPLINQMSRGEQTAQHIFGYTNSIYFYCHFIPGPGWGDDPGSFWGQKSDALFAATDMAQHWKYTLDTNYAAKVYPYLKEVANFWDNYLIYTNGAYVDYSDSVAENTGADTHPATTVAFLQLLLPTVVQMSQALNVDAGSRTLWGNIITNLYPISIVSASSIGSINSLGAPYNSSGVNVIQNCLSGNQFPTPMVTLYQDHTIRTSSPGMNSTQVIFPGWLVGLESPASTIKAATNTIWIAAEWFDFNDNCTFYPSAASVGYDPNAILSNLDILISNYRYNNFMIDVGGGGTENFSIIPPTLAAMFLQSYQTNMHVFPDWPTNQSASFGNLNACGGFLVSSAITLGKPNYIQIQSTAGQPLKLVNPWTNSTVQCVSSINGTTNLSGSILNYQTQVGEVLTLSTTNAALASPASVVVSTNNGALSFSWNSVPGAGGYNISRSSSPSGPFISLSTVTTGTSYTDTSTAYSTPYYYQVTAVEPGYQSTNPILLSVTSPARPPILNASFESQSVTQGSALVADPTSWSSSLSGAVDAVINPGANGSGEPWPSLPVPGMSGSNYCQIFVTANGGGGVVYQDTGLKYQAGCSYTLSAAFGLQTNQTFDAGSTMSLENSSLTPVASTNILSSHLSSGAFTPIALNYTGTGSEGGNGDVIVAFYAPPGSSQYYFDFDNVSLVVTTNSTPSITTQPASQIAVKGTNVSLSVGVTGASPLGYQWYYNTNTAIAGATTATLTLTNVQTSGTYDVVVTNTYGSITSSIATLTVQSATSPVSISIVNSNFSAQSVASGNYLNLGTAGPTGWSASGVGGAVVALVNPSTTDGRGFTTIPVPGLNSPNYCQIYAYQAGGTGIVYQDTGIKYQAGVTYNFTAAFGLENGAFPTGASMVFYNSNLTPLASQTISSNNLTLGSFTSQTLGYTATGAEGGNGDIIIGFSVPSTAAAASFDFGNVSLTQVSASAPGINLQPLSQSLYAGQSTSFSVSAYGSQPLTYQWQGGPVGGPYTNLVSGSQISGVNSNILTLSNASTNLPASYQVVITNAYGSLTSTPSATLSILPGTFLSIVNAGFDSNSITGGNAPGYQIVTPSGWTVSGTNASSYIGLINPLSLGTYTSTNGYSVSNALESISGDGVANPTVSQVLTNTLQANTTYTVSVQAGNRTSGTWGGYHVLLETTNGTLVGDWVGVINFAAPVGNIAASGTFATTARSFTTGANPPGLGQRLMIVLSQGAPTVGSYNDFDNVSVFAKPSTGHPSGTPIDVYISAGQSNDQGAYAFVPSLSLANLHYANAPDSRALFAYKHAQYNAPALSWNTGSIGQLSPDGAGHGLNLPGFGPELPVGSDLAVRFGKPLAMIKFAAGGANLDTQFQKSANFLYPQMIAEITNSLQQLTAQGYIPTIKGFFWLQGEADSTANPTTYTNDIANFVANVRADLQVPKLEFVLTQINPNMPAFANYQTGVAEVNAAMTTLVNSDTNVKFVTTADMTSGFGDGSVHYSADQIVTIGQRWAAAYTVQAPPAPASLTATPQTNAIALSCASVTNAAFYTIYRSKNSGGPYMKVASTSAPNYTDFNVAAGTTYYYVMSACNGYALSPYSPQSSAAPLGGGGGGSLPSPQASASPSITTGSPVLTGSTNTATPLVVVAGSSSVSGPMSAVLSKKVEQSLSTTPGKSYLLSVEVASSTGALVKGKLQFGESLHAIKTQSKSFTKLSWKVAVKTKSTKLTLTPESLSSKNQLLFRNLQVLPQ